MYVGLNLKVFEMWGWNLMESLEANCYTIRFIYVLVYGLRNKVYVEDWQLPCEA